MDRYMTNKNDEKFIKNLLSFGIELDDIKLEQFHKYYELLIEWNKNINLTAITEYGDVLTKHFLDSLSIVKAIDCKQTLSLIDVGTGAGFPGIPIKIVFPNIKVTLLDSLKKRVNFLDEVIKNLSLTDIEAIHGRAEDFAKEDKLREQYDISVSRAVANLSTLSELCLPYVNVNGKFISYKSEKADIELIEADNAIQILGGGNIEKIPFLLPGTEFERNIIVIDKIMKTPSKYPRKSGKPEKSPL